MSKHTISHGREAAELSVRLRNERGRREPGVLGGEGFGFSPFPMPLASS